LETKPTSLYETQGGSIRSLVLCGNPLAKRPAVCAAQDKPDKQSLEAIAFLAQASVRARESLAELEDCLAVGSRDRFSKPVRGNLDGEVQGRRKRLDVAFITRKSRGRDKSRI
jgi:hypothetical protein